MERSYFGSDHGKNESDSKTAELNRHLNLAINSRQAVLSDAGDITISPAPTGAEWERIRSVRDDLLMQSDWTQGADSPLNASKKTEWTSYRGKLRSLPEDQKSKTKFSDITWPTKP